MKKNNILVSLLTLLILIVLTIVLINSAGKQNPSVCEHDYGKFAVSKSATLFEVGEKQKMCKKCDDVVSERVNATIELPQLYLDGSTEGISKDNQCLVSAEYFQTDSDFNAFATIKYQGHTAMGYDKKNYTIKFYKDELMNEKYKFSLNGWDEINKYCLKANYIDYSSARNIVSSNIWRDVVSTRKNLDANIAELEFLGGIDGYPFALFINNEYQGLYTFNIPKDEDTYNIADEENEAMFVINSAFSDAANFKSLLTEEDKKSVYDLEYTYPEDSEWPYESMNKLIDFVIKNDGDEFRNGIQKYLDIDAAIDYLVTAYVLGVTDNFAKNMILITYDGQKWIPNMYDLDTACGLIFDGTGYLEPDFALPNLTDNGAITSGTDSLLWERILNNYREEFKVRYFELRKNVLDTEKLIARYTEFITSVPKECYKHELELYPDTPQKDINQIQQISDFMRMRTKTLDLIIEKF